MKTIRFLSFLIFINLSAFSQTATLPSTGEILQGIKKLNTVGAVLYVAAHPDDENTRLLTYLSKERNLRTGYLSLTRGDGGQNLIGKEQGEALGLIRTHELLAARSVDGAEQFFTRANDFGYSKNPEETFAFWNKDSILADVVWCIRNFRPDVIICRFPTTGEGGHGHHTASAILAVEAFSAAADSTKFPEQLKFVSTWQAKRIFWNTFNFGTTNTTAEDQLKLDIGLFNPLLGKSYGEIAAESRSMHKSQGFGSIKTRGESIEYFKLLAGDSVQTDLFDGVNLKWSRIPGAESVKQDIEFLKLGFDAFHPESSINTLVMLYKHLQQLSDKNNPEVRYWKQQKLKETEQLILAVSGVWMEASAAAYIGIPGDSVSVNTQIIARNPVKIKLQKLSWFGVTDSVVQTDLQSNKLYSFRHKELLPATAKYSAPYWLSKQTNGGLYSEANQQMIGKPQNDPAQEVIFHVNIEGLVLQIRRPVVYKTADPVKGEVYRPFEILPPVTVNFSERNFVFAGTAPQQIQLTVKANRDSISGRLQLDVPAGWRADIAYPDFFLASKGDEAIIPATVYPAAAGTAGLKASVTIGGASFAKSIRRIEYDHIPYQFILQDAEAGLVQANVRIAGNKVGYIEGAGDDVASCLKQVGYQVTILTDEMLGNADLSVYDVIVTGVRAYNTHDRLAVHYPRLMEYVKKGGNLTIQYNTNSRIGPLNSKIGPYPFTISRDRVTDENSPVVLLDTAQAVLNVPNRITLTDFDGWVQERGIYFATTRDSIFQPVLSMNDPGEKELDGGLIIAPYGSGVFVYTGLAFFRQLPAGVPGAYRLFANIIGLKR